MLKTSTTNKSPQVSTRLHTSPQVSFPRTTPVVPGQPPVPTVAAAVLCVVCANGIARSGRRCLVIANGSSAPVEH